MFNSKAYTVFLASLSIGVIGLLSSLVIWSPVVSYYFALGGTIFLMISFYAWNEYSKIRLQPYQAHILEVLNPSETIFDARAASVRAPDDHRAIAGRFGYNGIEVNFRASRKD